MYDIGYVCGKLACSALIGDKSWEVCSTTIKIYIYVVYVDYLLSPNRRQIVGGVLYYYKN